MRWLLTHVPSWILGPAVALGIGFPSAFAGAWILGKILRCYPPRPEDEGDST